MASAVVACLLVEVGDAGEDRAGSGKACSDKTCLLQESTSCDRSEGGWTCDCCAGLVGGGDSESYHSWTNSVGGRSSTIAIEVRHSGGYCF